VQFPMYRATTSPRRSVNTVEREYRRFNPKGGGGVEGVLFADEQG